MLSNEIKKVHNRLSELLHVVTKEQAEILLLKNCLLDCVQQAKCIEKNFKINSKKEQGEEC